MKKTHNPRLISAVLFFWIIALSEFAYFMWQPNSKGILFHIIGNPAWISSLILHILYFFLFFSAITRIVQAFTEAGEKPKRFYDHKCFMTVLLLFLVQIGFDLLWLAVRAPGYYALCFYDALTVLEWILIAVVLRKRCFPGKRSRTAAAKDRVICCGIVLLALTAALLLDLNDIGKLQKMDEKYAFNIASIFSVSPTIHQRTVNNIGFRYDLRGKALSVITGTALMTQLCVSNGNDKTKASKASSTVKVRVIGVMIVSIIVVILTSQIAILLRPSDFLTGFTIDAFYPDGSRYDPDEISLDSSTFEIIRGGSDSTIYPPAAAEAKSIYCVSRCKVWYAGRVQFSFSVDRGYPGYYDSALFKIVGSEDNPLLFQNSDVKMAVFADQVIAWTSGDEVHHMKVDDLGEAAEDPAVTAICEELVSRANWECFEYCCLYLQKYEPASIAPYIERYAEGDFTQSELSENSEIRPEYIQAVARRVLTETD